MSVQGSLDALFGIKREVPEQAEEKKQLCIAARKKPATECKFTWPPECPFGQRKGEKLYAVSAVRGCPNGCTYCWMREFWKPAVEEARYEDPVWLEGVFSNFDQQLRKNSEEMAGNYLLLSNTTDPLAEPAVKVFPNLAASALLRGMNLVVLSKSAPPLDDAIIPILERAVVASERPVWWGATITTTDDDVAAEIEPHSARPNERLEFLNAVQSWAQVNGLSDRVKPWVSVGGWHKKTNIMAVLEQCREYNIRLIIIEVLHKKKNCPIVWKDWIPDEKDVSVKVLEEVVHYGAQNGISIILKDELRRIMWKNAGLRGAYVSMHGDALK